MKASSSSSSSYTFGYAALDWCCEGNASLPDDKHAPLHCASSDSLPNSCSSKQRDTDSKPRSFFRRHSPVDSNASASTASTTQDDLSEPPMLPADPTWEVPLPETLPVPSHEVPPPLEPCDRDERALGPIDLDALEDEEEEQMIPHPSSSHDSSLGSLNTAASLELPDRESEKPDAVAATETPAAPTIPESPTEMTESVHVVEDPLLLLLLSQGPERTAPRDPAQLDALLQNILQEDDVTLASSTAHASGDLMDVLAAGPVDVDDFIPEDSYWSMNTQDFCLDEVEVSRQLAGYQEGCEPPCIEHVDYAPSPPRTRLTRQRTAATAETAELLRRAQGLHPPLRRPDVVRRHVTAPSAPTRIPQVRPTVTHPGVGRPSGASVRSQHATGSTLVRRPMPRSMPPSPQRVQRTVPPSPHASVATHSVRRAVAPSPQRVASPSWQPATHSVRPRTAPPSQHVVPPPALRKERRWLPESAAEV